MANDRVLLVTGGSRGIGAATARLAAQRGFAVAVNYVHQQQAAENIVAEIERDGGRAIAVQADIASEASIMAMVERLDRELGPLTALVNNAGILEEQARVNQLTAD